MTTGYDALIKCESSFHAFKSGEYVWIHKAPASPTGCYQFVNDSGLKQYVEFQDFEWLHEDTPDMTKKQSNPKNFRNGDVIKVSDKRGNDAMVFVKFGENYYNLTAGGQMKACRYLPPGTKEIITNLSGMGKFFLMSEEELEEQAGSAFGGGITVTEEDYYWTPQKLLQE